MLDRDRESIAGRFLSRDSLQERAAEFGVLSNTRMVGNVRALRWELLILQSTEAMWGDDFDGAVRDFLTAKWLRNRP